MLVKAAHVQRRRHGDSRAQAGQTLREFQPGLPDVDGAVDVRMGNVEQLGCAEDLGHSRHYGHRQARGRAVFTVQHRAVVGSKLEWHEAILVQARGFVYPHHFSVNSIWLTHFTHLDP